jgi:hypothetical protein
MRKKDVGRTEGGAGTGTPCLSQCSDAALLGFGSSGLPLSATALVHFKGVRLSVSSERVVRMSGGHACTCVCGYQYPPTTLVSQSLDVVAIVAIGDQSTAAMRNAPKLTPVYAPTVPASQQNTAADLEGEVASRLHSVAAVAHVSP